MALVSIPLSVVTYPKDPHTGWPKKVSHYHVSSVNRIKTLN